MKRLEPCFPSGVTRLSFIAHGTWTFLNLLYLEDVMKFQCQQDKPQERKPSSRPRVLPTGNRKKVAKATRAYMSCGIFGGQRVRGNTGSSKDKSRESEGKGHNSLFGPKETSGLAAVRVGDRVRRRGPAVALKPVNGGFSTSKRTWEMPDIQWSFPRTQVSVYTIQRGNVVNCHR